MARINRYDTPAQADFINTYVPIPFEEMMKVGAMKQQLVEQNDQAASELMAQLGAIKVAPWDEQNYLDYRNQKQAELNKVLNEAQPGSYEAKRKILDIRNEMLLNPELRAMIQNYEPYTKAATELREMSAKYGADSAAVYARQKQFNEVAQGEKGVRGTRYLMQKYGSGILQPAGIGPNKAVKPIIDTYIDDIKEEAIGRDAIDKSGRYIIGTSSKSITPERLGAPLGIKFNVVVENGKKVLLPDTKNVSIPVDIFKTEEGVTLRNEAEKLADLTGITFEEALKQRYLDTALRSIAEKVSQSSEMTIKADPYGEMYARKALEEQKTVFTIPVMIGEKGRPELSSVASLGRTKDTFANNILGIQKQKEEYIEKYASRAVGDSYDNLIDDEGRDVSTVLSEYNAAIQQEQDKINDLAKVEADVRRDLGIPERWKVTDDFTPEEIEEVREDARRKANHDISESGGAAGDVLKLTDEWTDKLLEKKSANYKRINAALKENAKSRLVDAGVTTIPTVSDQKLVEDVVFKFTNEGAGNKNRLGGASMAITDAKTGEPFTDKDYEKLARTTEEKNKPEVGGLVYSPAKGWPQIYVRFKNKAGELMSPSLVDAPLGMEDLYIKAGKIDAAEIMVQREFANITNTADQTGILGNASPGAKPGDAVELRVFKTTRQNNLPGAKKYELTFVNPATGEKAAKPYSLREEAISDYIRYKQAVDNYRTTGKFEE